MSDTAAALRSIVADYLGVDPTEITETTLFSDLGADSLDIVEIHMAVEDHFIIEISDDEIAPFDLFGDAPGKSFGDMCTLIDGKLAKVEG